MNTTRLFFGTRAIPLRLPDTEFVDLRAVAYSLAAGWDVPSIERIIDFLEYYNPSILQLPLFVLYDYRLGRGVMFAKYGREYIVTLTVNPYSETSALASMADYASFVIGSFLPF